ncbi:hypothetical protein D9M68_902860 [compost metagenome]
MAGDGAHRFGPVDQAELLSMVPAGGLLVARIGNRVGAVGWAAATGDGAGAVLPAMHAQIAGLILRHDQVIPQDAILHHEAVE